LLVRDSIHISLSFSLTLLTHVQVVWEKLCAADSNTQISTTRHAVPYFALLIHRS